MIGEQYQVLQDPAIFSTKRRYRADSALGTRMLLLCHHNCIESEVPAGETDICTDNRAQYFQSTPFNIVKLILLYRQECYGGKLTTRILHVKLHPRLEWRIFHIL